MRNYKMIIQYDGTRYLGWQAQISTKNTIQQKIELVLTKMVGEEVKIQGSGRTDSGVHAEKQVANVRLETVNTPEEIKIYLNMYLPEDIRIIEVREASDRFHSRLNAIKKTYCYSIETDEKADVFRRKYVYTLGHKLNLKAMNEATELLCGTHDFQGFSANKVKKKSTIRTLLEIRIQEEDSLLRIFYIGNGFLHHMVRIITGTLIEIGLNERPVSSITEILTSKDRKIAGVTAPAQGLCLLEVFYD